MTSPDPTLAQRQQLWTVQGIPGHWATKTGGEVAAETRKVYNGGEETPEVMGGPPQSSNIILTRPYKASLRDLEARLAPLCGEWRTTLVGADRDKAGIPIGKPRVHAGALLRRVKPPDYDESSAEPGMFEIEFEIPSARS